jgi:hypothetical protein
LEGFASGQTAVPSPSLIVGTSSAECPFWCACGERRGLIAEGSPARVWHHVNVVARCKVYEVQGPDRSHPASAHRCRRDATELAIVDHRVVSVCAKHDHEPWELFVGADQWLYALNPNADPMTEKKKGRRKK